MVLCTEIKTFLYQISRNKDKVLKKGQGQVNRFNKNVMVVTVVKMKEVIRLKVSWNIDTLGVESEETDLDEENIKIKVFPEIDFTLDLTIG